MKLILLCLAALAVASARGDYDLKDGTLLKAENSEMWCKTCGVFVSVFDKIMENQQVQGFLDGLLEEALCTKLPAVESECEEELPKIVSAVISFLESLADARLCTGMGVCQPSSLRELFLREKEGNSVKAYNAEACDMCNKYAQELETKIDNVDPESIAQYKQIILQSCSKLGSMEEQCSQFVEKNSYLLMYYLMKEKSEGNILKICTDINEIASRSGEGIAGPEFKAEVNKYLTHMCSYAPPIKKKCTEKLTEMSTKALDYLASTVKPDGICEKLGVCGDGDVSKKDAMALEGSAPKVTYVS